MNRALWTALGVMLGISMTVGSRFLWEHVRDSGCEERDVVKGSPDGGMRATLRSRTCDWGFGLSAEFSTVHIEKLGAHGWFMDIPLNVDQPPDTSTIAIAWDDNNSLEADVSSREFSGTLEEKTLGFTFRQVYRAISPSRNAGT